jgi:hypothetical protein
MKYNYICKLDKKDCICSSRLKNGFCKENERVCPYQIKNIFNNIRKV